MIDIEKGRTVKNIDQKDIGLYKKFTVKRTDGQHKKGCKHEDCTYFVLDMTHDKHAIPALKAYAKSCKKEYPRLSGELCQFLFLKTLKAPKAPR